MRHQPEVPRVHHGPGNALFNPKFCAEVPRDVGAPLNVPTGGTFYSAAALLAHTKISWLFHSQDQRGPSPSISPALLQERGTVVGRNGQWRTNARYKNHQAYPQANRNEKKTYRHPFLTQECFYDGSPWLPVATAGVQHRVDRPP